MVTLVVIVSEAQERKKANKTYSGRACKFSSMLSVIFWRFHIVRRGSGSTLPRQLSVRNSVPVIGVVKWRRLTAGLGAPTSISSIDSSVGVGGAECRCNPPNRVSFSSSVSYSRIGTRSPTSTLERARPDLTTILCNNNNNYKAT